MTFIEGGIWIIRFFGILVVISLFMIYSYRLIFYLIKKKKGDVFIKEYDHWHNFVFSNNTIREHGNLWMIVFIVILFEIANVIFYLVN